MSEHLSQHRRFHLLVCLVVVVTGSFFSLFFKRNDDTVEEDNQRSITVLSSPYCDHFWIQDNYSSTTNIIQRSQMSSLFGINLLFKNQDIISRNRSRVNELRIEALLHRINTIHDTVDDNPKDVVFKVVVLGNSMTAGTYLTDIRFLHRRTYSVTVLSALSDHYSCMFLTPCMHLLIYQYLL